MKRKMIKSKSMGVVVPRSIRISRVVDKMLELYSLDQGCTINSAVQRVLSEYLGTLSYRTKAEAAIAAETVEAQDGDQ